MPSPILELSGPYSTQQHSGVYISASLDPSYMVPEIDWQGCSPAQGNNASCFFPASTTGLHVITASIDGGGPSEEWTVYVDP